LVVLGLKGYWEPGVPFALALIFGFGAAIAALPEEEISGLASFAFSFSVMSCHHLTANSGILLGTCDQKMILLQSWSSLCGSAVVSRR
jgi:hypothetical protein